MKNDENIVRDAIVVVGGILGAIFVVWLFVFGINWIGARATPQAGQIGVVRSGPSAVWAGDWFNGHQIKKIIAPGSGSTYIGIGSSTHYYPSDSVQRQYTITADPTQGDQPGVDYVQVPTSDGIEVSLEGSFYFTTGFNASPAGESLVRDFDNRFGVRQFSVSGTNGTQLYPWVGNSGWESFLNTVIRPIINNDLRKGIASVTCEQLVSSCALVHNQTVAAVKNTGKTNTQQIQQIQNEINSSLQTDIASALGRDYFSNVQFLLSRVELPGSIQSQIESAQAQFAAVGTAQAKVQQETLNAKANEQKEKGFKACPACAEASVLAAIPSNVTTFAPAAGFAITK